MRFEALDIAKAIAIILMVIGHTEYPVLQTFIYEFHMPLFFIAAGYCFNTKYLNDEATFVKRRFKGLYWPYLKWSVVFLCIHNLMFDIGILNEQFGNGSGGVIHPYTWHQFWQRIWNCVFNMSGYDEFLTGAFWFFRALLFASVAFLILMKLLNKIRFLRERYFLITIIIAIVALLMAIWKTSENLTITGLPQGGFRDLMGTFFFAVGYAIRQKPGCLNVKWWGALSCFLVVLAGTLWFNASMGWKGCFNACIYLPIPAIAGFFMTYWVATKIASKENILKRFMLYCGQNTMCIFIFHIICFKIVSALKIWYYGLDWGHIGSHMIVHHEKSDFFWILYTIVAVGVPLLWNYGYDRLITHFKNKES